MTNVYKKGDIYTSMPKNKEPWWNDSPQNYRNRRFIAGFLGITFLVITMYFDIANFHLHTVPQRWRGTTTSDHTQPRYHNPTISGISILSNRMTGRSMSCSDDFRIRHLMTVEFNGRTGNQIFQIATLLGITESICYTPVMTHSHRIGHVFDLQNVEKVQNTSSFNTLNETGAGKFDPNITSKITPNFNWTLQGFRQSYKYFQNYSEYVRSSFRFKPIIKRDVIAYLRQKTFHDRPKVCMHVRRGDFVNKAFRKGFSVASIEYINASITYMAKHLKTSNFSLIVASDDKVWCKQNIHLKGGNVFISPFKDIGRDLFLMTQCDHNIITSGSFSWMGAWLNETGVVVYYKLYPEPNSFLAKHFRNEDYYPSHWIGL